MFWGVCLSNQSKCKYQMYNRKMQRMGALRLEHLLSMTPLAVLEILLTGTQFFVVGSSECTANFVRFLKM